MVADVMVGKLVVAVLKGAIGKPALIVLSEDSA